MRIRKISRIYWENPSGFPNRLGFSKLISSSVWAVLRGLGGQKITKSNQLEASPARSERSVLSSIRSKYVRATGLVNLLATLVSQRQPVDQRRLRASNVFCDLSIVLLIFVWIYFGCFSFWVWWVWYVSNSSGLTFSSKVSHPNSSRVCGTCSVHRQLTQLTTAALCLRRKTSWIE